MDYLFNLMTYDNTFGATLPTLLRNSDVGF